MIAPHTIRWRFTAAFVLIILAVIVILGFYLSNWTDDYYVSELGDNLTRESKVTGSLAASLISSNPASVNELARKVGQQLGRRVTIIRADGLVLGDSEHDFRTMESHKERPEVVNALLHGTGSTIRYSSTIHRRMLYVATRIGSREYPLGVARLSESLADVDSAKGRIHKAFFIAGLVALILASAVSARIASRIASPMQHMSAVARRLAKGELDQRVAVGSKQHDELAELGSTLNAMAAGLSGILSELSVERSKLRTIFERTDDGLMVVDSHARVQMINPSGVRLVGLSSEHIVRKTVIECSLSHDLADLVDRVLRTSSAATLEVQIAGVHETHVSAYVAPLDDENGTFGAIVVLHDQTEQKRIDAIRRDFVANVSHELRTPLASIKAMAETISLRGRSDPTAAAEFAEKIALESDRLVAISEDLLDLAAIESGRRAIHYEQFLLTQVVESTIGKFRRQAEQKGVVLETKVSREISARADKDALHQIMINLIDNAIKYTQPRGQVSISAMKDSETLTISVSDTGIGIPSGDLPRIFERFYRVDKGRSRESGGTGLGLSIVKHLVELQNGKVFVDSVVGQGSIFSFTLPAE